MQQHAMRRHYWSAVLATKYEDLGQALSPQGRLIGMGLVQSAGGIPTLSDFWVELLLKKSEPFGKILLRQMPAKGSTGGAARLPDEDREILQRLFRSRHPGTNVLFFGKAGVDKQSLAYKLICSTDLVPYELSAEIPENDLPVAAMVAQRVLADMPDTVLVIQKTTSVLTRQMPDISFFFGGLVETDAEARPLDERILLENPVPTLWLTANPQRLHTET